MGVKTVGWTVKWKGQLWIGHKTHMYLLPTKLRHRVPSRTSTIGQYLALFRHTHSIHSACSQFNHTQLSTVQGRRTRRVQYHQQHMVVLVSNLYHTERYFNKGGTPFCFPRRLRLLKFDDWKQFRLFVWRLNCLLNCHPPLDCTTIFLLLLLRAANDVLTLVGRFRDNIKIVHFIGAIKPWHHPYNTATKTVTTFPETGHCQEFLQAWWNIFMEVVQPNLDPSLVCRTLSHVLCRRLVHVSLSVSFSLLLHCRASV